MGYRRTSLLNLIPITVDDVDERYVAWMADPVVTRFIVNSGQSLEELQEYVVAVIADKRSEMYRITVDGVWIGNIKVTNGDVGILIGEKDYWNKGHGAEAISLVGGQTAGVHPKNVASIRAFQRAGWTIAGSRGDDILLWRNHDR